jgi:hypothetical protein
MELHATLPGALAPMVTAAVASATLTCTAPATPPRHVVQLQVDGGVLTSVSAVCKRVAAGSALVRAVASLPLRCTVRIHASNAMRRTLWNEGGRHPEVNALMRVGPG